MTATLVEPVAVRLTAEEYEALPPNSRRELVDGVLSVMTPPTRRHQHVVELLERKLEGFCPPELVIVREQELRSGYDRRPDRPGRHRRPAARCRVHPGGHGGGRPHGPAGRVATGRGRPRRDPLHELRVP